MKISNAQHFGVGRTQTPAYQAEQAQRNERMRALLDSPETERMLERFAGPPMPTKWEGMVMRWIPAMFVPKRVRDKHDAWVKYLYNLARGLRAENQFVKFHHRRTSHSDQ